MLTGLAKVRNEPDQLNIVAQEAQHSYLNPVIKGLAECDREDAMQIFLSINSTSRAANHVAKSQKILCDIITILPNGTEEKFGLMMIPPASVGDIGALFGTAVGTNGARFSVRPTAGSSGCG